MKYNNHILFAAASLLIVAFASCREGVIDPRNAVGNLNEPVVYKSADAYTFQIDAKNITFSNTDETFLDITETDVVVQVTGYSGGSVSIKVIGDNLATLYSSQVNNDIDGKQISIINHIADKLRIEFFDFSGRLKVQLTKTPRSF